MASGFIEALKRNCREVEELEGDHAEEFLRLLKELQEEMRGRLSAIGQSDEAVNVFSIRRVIGETEAGIKILESKAEGQYSKAQKEAVDLSVEHIGEELERLSRAFDARPLDISLDAAKALADPAQGLLADHFESSVAKYGHDLLNGVRQRLFIGLRAGDSMGSIVRDIAGEKGPFGLVGRSKAETIVRTEVSQTYGAAQHHGLVQAQKQIPQLKSVWLHVGSWRCDVCMPLHGTERPANGKWIIKIGHKTREVVHPPAHPNCLIAGTLIQTPSGLRRIEEIVPGDEVTGGLTGKPRRVTWSHINNFSGRLFVVTGDDFEITLTGNHPILTDRGWTPAEDLQIGDKVFRHQIKGGARFPDGLAAQTCNHPSLGFEKSFFRIVLGNFSSRVMPSAGVDFDGDFFTGNSNVDVEFPDTELRFASATDQIQDLEFKTRRSAISPECSRSFKFFDGRLFSPASGIVCSSGNGLSLFRSTSGIEHQLSTGAIAPLYSVSSHRGVDSRSTAMQLFRHFQDRNIVEPMHSTERVGIEFNPFHVRSIVRLPHIGKVFNLTVDSDESYVANGIVVHNCVCRISAMKPKWRDELSKLGYLDQDPGDKRSSPAQL